MRHPKNSKKNFADLALEAAGAMLAALREVL